MSARGGQRLGRIASPPPSEREPCLVRDRADQFTTAPDAILAGADIDTVKIPPRCPGANGVADGAVIVDGPSTWGEGISSPTVRSTLAGRGRATCVEATASMLAAREPVSRTAPTRRLGPGLRWRSWLVGA
jgi:hypothetical protein